MDYGKPVQEGYEMAKSEPVAQLLGLAYDPLHVGVVCHLALVLGLYHREPYQEGSPLVQILGAQFELLKKDHDGFEGLFHQLFCLACTGSGKHNLMLEVLRVYRLQEGDDILEHGFNLVVINNQFEARIRHRVECVHAHRVYVILHSGFNGINQRYEVIIYDPKQYLLRALLVLDRVFKFCNPQNQVEVLIEGEVLYLVCGSPELF
jgi:hypothetical protein